MAKNGPEHYEESAELQKAAEYAENPTEAVIKRLDALIHATHALMYAVLQAGQLDDKDVKHWARHGVEL